MGEATITAARNDAQGRARLTVLDSPDRDALVAFYEATNGANWWNNSGWLLDAPLNTWRGVKTNEWGRVVGLSSYNNNLRGRIPPEIGKLEKLEDLWLGDVLLTEPIPPEIGELKALKKLGLWASSMGRYQARFRRKSGPGELGAVGPHYFHLHDSILQNSVI